MITKAFNKELEFLLNKHGVDSLCNVPDFMLSEHLCNYLVSLQELNRKVDIWYGRVNQVTLNVQNPPSAHGKKKKI